MAVGIPGAECHVSGGRGGYLSKEEEANKQLKKWFSGVGESRFLPVLPVLPNPFTILRRIHTVLLPTRTEPRAMGFLVTILATLKRAGGLFWTGCNGTRL
jgi:hypothetical protein